MSYVKLFSDILASTIWAEPDHTRIVWITMLAMADRDGCVMASVPGLAHLARVGLEQTQEALHVLGDPDPHSRTKDHDGRRISEIAGGWRILNYESHRERSSIEESRAKAAERQRRKYYRDKLRDADVRSRDDCKQRENLTKPHGDGDGDGDSVPAMQSVPPVPEIPQGQRVTSHDHAVTDRDAASPPKSTRKPRPSEAGGDFCFGTFWKWFANKVSRKAAAKAWDRIDPDADLAKRICFAGAKYRKACVDADHPQKHPTTWLNGECWNDEDLPRPRDNRRRT